MIKVIKEGFFSTIQDNGRLGYRHIGVPVCGAMDAYAAHLANSLLENDKDDALLEITMTGPELQFEASTFIALTGAIMPAYLNNEQIERNTVIAITKGDILTFGNPSEGLRLYLAVKNGLQIPEILGSRSYYKPITDERCLRPGMSIPFMAVEAFNPRISVIQTTDNFNERMITVYPGPEFDILTKEQLRQLFKKDHHIAKENNRMAYQLEERIEGHEMNIVTSATLPGTIQLTPSGKLIILMRDAQTTGGYPRILQLKTPVISHLSQKKQGDSIRLKLTD